MTDFCSLCSNINFLYVFPAYTDRIAFSFYIIQYTCTIKCNTQLYKLIQYLDLSTVIIRQNVWFCHGLLIHNYKYFNNRQMNYTFADENWAQQIHSNKNATPFININIIALKLENRIWVKINCITWWCQICSSSME